ncbi:hypothetical protein GGI19_002303 [Coemansia pectinata]|uniref:PH domain-containing protein n=1 Tax=Coemansia pectinata TaxID=1052879 RepID=A0A9W8H0C7_9FUNG|nr:hypothetical protein GGI19_002303 [Coemansia pectinata]
MSIAQPFLEPSDRRTAGADRPSPSATTASAAHNAVVIDGAGLACSGSAAAVHKHPFAPIQLDEEPTHRNLFRHACHSHHCPKGSRHRSKAVRAFIGPISTSWMQGHKRWWAKTAEKLESKTSGSSKIRRRESSSRSARDSKGGIRGLGRRRGSEDSLSSVGSISSSSSSVTSGSHRSSVARSSDWSSHSDGGGHSDSDIAVESPKNRSDRLHTQDGSRSGKRIPESLSGILPLHRHPQPERNSIPMPVLSSPTSARTLNPVSGRTESPAQMSPVVPASDSETKTHGTRRRSSLSSLKALLHRPSRLWHREQHGQSQRSTIVQVSQKSLDTILSVTSTNESLEITPMSPSRGRAASLSNTPLSSSGPLGSGQVAGRKSLDTGPSKLTSLMRSAMAKRARSVTWQPDSDQNAEPKAITPVVPISASDASMRAEAYLQQVVPPDKFAAADAATTPEAPVPSSKWRSRMAVAAKVKAYYQRHAQLSETTVILSTRAVVRRETASHTAFTEKYNEATCQRFRQGVQEWSEMWLALTKRGILFYLTSKKRPTVQILFPPYISIAPRVSLFSTLDLSLAITYCSRRHAEDTATDKKGKAALGSAAAEESESNKSTLRVVIVKFPSFQVACEWYREIGQILLFGRILYPQCFLGAIAPAAQSPPNSVLVSVPEMGVKVQVKLGRHNAEVPNNVLLGGTDDRLLEHQWRCEATTVWHIRRDVVNVLLSDKTIEPQMQQWLDAEREGLMSVGMAWRRFDRLDWVIPCGALDSTGNFKVSSVNELVIGPQLLEGTHTLELRILEHYPDSVEIDGTSVSEPMSVEGFVMLKRDKKRRTEIVTYRPVLLTSHDNWLFLIKAPRAAQHMDVSDSACDTPLGCSGAHASASSTNTGIRNDGDDNQVVCYHHPNQRTSSKQMSMAKYMLNITEVDQIVPILHDYDDAAHDGSLRSESIASVDAESVSTHSSHAPQTASIDSGTHRAKAKGKLLGFLRAKKNRQTACKFKLVTRAGATVVLWAASEQCMHEWVRRLTELRYYWINRLLSDLTLRSQVGVLNYALQGRRSREKDMPDWNDEKAWADRAIWHACLNLGCRDIIMSGTLYRKRHRHQGMRKIFCILTRGRIIEYKCPQAPHAPIQSVLAEQIVRRDARMSQLFDGARDSSGGGFAHAAMSDISSEATSSIANNSEARLLYAKSRSLALRRCYVVSRFIDDLNTNDIMCEPWVMTDIGNYSGLRLADRVYADGVISHELINDCVFTVWRPTFVPAILRSGEAPEIGVVPDDALGDASELSVDEYHANSGPESRAASPVIHGTEIKRTVSFSPLTNEPRSAFSDTHAASSPSQPRHPHYHHRHSNLGQHRRSPDTSGQSVDGHRKSSDAQRASAEVPRLSTEGYLSSASNASSGWSSGRPHEPNKPGAYRVGNEIHVSVDDKRDGTKRMNAMAMVSSMRHRVGVYKARTSAEMEQWVTAINQEIRRMSLNGEW